MRNVTKEAGSKKTPATKEEDHKSVKKMEKVTPFARRANMARRHKKWKEEKAIFRSELREARMISGKTESSLVFLYVP